MAVRGLIFSGPIQAEWLDDGRKMLLLSSTTYTDPTGVEWTAPAGRVVDGASIPRLFWRIAGSPFVGLHRVPSVYHDIACEDRARSYKQVHRMFYNCMIDCGENPGLAKVKGEAVENFGPRWDEYGIVLAQDESPIFEDAI